MYKTHLILGSNGECANGLLYKKIMPLIIKSKEIKGFHEKPDVSNDIVGFRFVSITWYYSEACLNQTSLWPTLCSE